MNITHNNFLMIAINLKNFYNIGNTLSYIFILRTADTINHYKLVFNINKLNEDDLDQNKTFNYYITDQDDNKIFSGAESNILDYDDLSVVEQKNYHNNFSFFGINLLDILPELSDNNLTGYIFEEIFKPDETKFRILNDEEINALDITERREYKHKLKEYELKEDARIKNALLYSSSFNSGLKIEVPISEQYKSQLLNEIERQLLFFETKPYIIEYTNFGPMVHELVAYQEVLQQYFIEFVPNFYLSEKKILDGNIWWMDKKYSDFISAYSKVTNRGENLLLVQGNVTYPIDLQAMIDTLKSASRDPRFEIESEYLPIVEALRTGYYNSIDVTSFRNFFCGVMFFDIGEINFHPSRESLNYDITTSLKIFDKIVQVIKLVGTKMMDTLNACIDDIHLAGVKYNIGNQTNLMFENDKYFGPTRLNLIGNIFPKILLNITPEKTVLEKLKELYKPGEKLVQLTTTKRDPGSENPEIGKVTSNRASNYKVATGYNFENALLTAPLSTVLVFVDSWKSRKNFMEHYIDIINYYIGKAKTEDQEAVADYHEKNPDTLYEDAPRKHCKVIGSSSIQLVECKVQGLPTLTSIDNPNYGLFQPIFINREHLKDENISPEDFMKALGMASYNDIYPRAFNLKDEIANLIKIGKASLPEKTRSSTAGIQKAIGTIKIDTIGKSSLSFSESNLYYKKKLRDEQLVEIFDKILAANSNPDLTSINKTIIILPLNKRGERTKINHQFFNLYNHENHSSEIYNLMLVSKFDSFATRPDGANNNHYVISINENMFEQVRDELNVLANNTKYLAGGIKILDINAPETIDVFFDHIVKTYSKKVIDITQVGEIMIDPRYIYNRLNTHLNKIFTNITEYENFKHNPYPRLIKEFYFSWYVLHNTVLNNEQSQLNRHTTLILKIFLYKASDIALPQEIINNITFDIYTKSIYGSNKNRTLILEHILKKYNEIKPKFIQISNNNIFDLNRLEYNSSGINKNEYKYPLLNNILHVISNKSILDLKKNNTNFDKLVNRFEKINPNIYRNVENVLTNYLKVYVEDFMNIEHNINFLDFDKTGTLLSNGEMQYKILASTSINRLQNQETKNKKLKSLIFGKEYKKQKQLAMKVIADMYEEVVEQTDQECSIQSGDSCSTSAA
jgi:hypothetical protein